LSVKYKFGSYWSNINSYLLETQEKSYRIAHPHIKFSMWSVSMRFVIKLFYAFLMSPIPHSKAAIIPVSLKGLAHL